MKDALGYYQILGISHNADTETIKQAYRELAKKWHPDNSLEPDNTKLFQKLSEAYHILGDDENRLIYDIFSLAYNEKNYPDVASLDVYTDNGNGTTIKAFVAEKITAWLSGYSRTNTIKIGDYDSIIKTQAIVAAQNWLFGWWHPKAFVQNIQAIVKNLRHPVSEDESLKIYLNNMIAYAKQGKKNEATVCGALAAKILPKTDTKYIAKFLSNPNIASIQTPKWNNFCLRFVQLVVPAAIIIVGLAQTKQGDIFLADLFSRSEKINYYQTVNYGKKAAGVDDVVVGKVISIPIDKSDNSKLYHLSEPSKIMYGPSPEFDIIKILDKGTTVRLTGYTPDNIWARVMIDNGEIGFMHLKKLVQGIGEAIPFGSAITE